MPENKPLRGLIDTHCHLEMSQFDPDRDEVIRRAREGGVEAMLTIGSDIQSNPLAIGLAETHENIYCTVGIHPHDAKEVDDEVIAEIKKMASNPKAVAIGETGLDYHYDNSPREVQKHVFRTHLALAKDLGMPAIVHSREASDDTVSILRESGITKGVMHCFSATKAVAEAAMSMGLSISIAGPVTFPKAVELREIAAWVPDDYLLLETDAPYLAPVPLRGKRNEPAYIAHTARAVAKLRGISAEDLARITSLNARRLFGLPGVSEHGVIAYRIRDSLYLNITNRCTNRCTFCVRYSSDFVKGHNLRLDSEPTVEEITRAIGDPKEYKEIVFCGYGEPTLRLDEVKDVSAWVKKRGGRVRLNTNGHANIVHGRNIVPELKGLVDAVSVSLDAQDAETYERLCVPGKPGAYDAVVDFIREAAKHIPSVQATVVDMEDVDIDACRALAESLGATLRVRALHSVG